MVELRHNHWTYPCVIIVWTIIIGIHLWRIFLDCQCMTVSSFRLKWEMPYLPGLGGPNGILRSFLYKQVLYWIKNTTWAYFDNLLTCTGMKKITLVYCFKIAAAADVRDCVSQLLSIQDANDKASYLCPVVLLWVVDPHVVLCSYGKTPIVLFQNTIDSMSFLPRKVHGQQISSEYARRWFRLAC